jgi:hypothetical protein
MGEVARVNNLSLAIAEAFANHITYTDVVPKGATNIQTQVAEVICGTDTTSCYDCVKAYDLHLGDKGYYCPKGNCPGNASVNYVRDHQCRPICVCDFQVVQANSVTLKSTGTVKSVDLEKIIVETRKIIAKKYPDFVPSESSIETIIRQNMDVVIQQAVTAAQYITLEGLGTFKNIKTSTVMNAMFNAIAQNSMAALRDSVQTYVSIIKTEVETKVRRTIGQILLGFLPAWITLGALIFLMFVINIFLWIRKFKKGT